MIFLQILILSHLRPVLSIAGAVNPLTHRGYIEYLHMKASQGIYTYLKLCFNQINILYILLIMTYIFEKYSMKYCQYIYVTLSTYYLELY